jgi:glycogen synthase
MSENLFLEPEQPADHVSVRQKKQFDFDESMLSESDSVDSSTAPTIIIPRREPDPKLAESKKSERPLKLIYLAGCGDILTTHQHWNSGKEDQNDLRPAYSSQFFEFCRQGNHEGWAISSHPRSGVVNESGIRVEHRSQWFPKTRGWKFHLVQSVRSCRVMLDALRYRADAVIVNYGSCHLFLLGMLPLFGIQVIPSFHNILMVSNRQPNKMQRHIFQLNGRFLRRRAHAVLSISEAVDQQLLAISQSDAVRIERFSGVYESAWFGTITQPEWDQRPFRVLFMGRLEQDKGIYTLLDLARRFQASKLPVVIEICGDGGHKATLQQQIDDAKLHGRIRLHGHCTRDQLHTLLGQSHVVIVPTTADFPEGLNQTAIQGILAGRPVIVSDVCPVKSLIPGAAIEVTSSDLDGYYDAIAELSTDPDLYEKCQRATLAVRDQFFDRSRSWHASLERALQWL